MGVTANVGLASRGTGASRAADQGVAALDVSQFLDLLIAQLANQDPLAPLENDQILAQVSQLRNIESSNKLVATLDQFLLIQQLSGASSLIGKQVEAISTDPTVGRFQGNVETAFVDKGKVYLTVIDQATGDERLVALESITAILSSSESQPAAVAIPVSETEPPSTS
jgi:flagellar basal-body rod modification protein FlgD